MECGDTKPTEEDSDRSSTRLDSMKDVDDDHVMVEEMTDVSKIHKIMHCSVTKL